MAPYPHVESQTNQIVLHGLSNKQMGIKLQGEGSNPGPPTKPSSDTMLNDQFSKKLELVGFVFNMNIMLLNNDAFFFFLLREKVMILED